jgi:hypothetical protein
MKSSIKIYIASIFLATLTTACKKLVEIPQPSKSITDTKVYSNDANANSAVVAIYEGIVSRNGPFFTRGYGNAMTTITSGASADELNCASYFQFQQNKILSTDGIISAAFWTPAYYNIYQANAAIEGLQASNGVSTLVKKELIAEAKFIRAFCHFYLVNLFGDVPLITESNWSEINTISRTKTSFVYAQIINDLTDAQKDLPKDYSVAGGEKIRANYWAATALLSRAYLYTGDWKDAEMQATNLISSGNFNLSADLNTVFLKNSAEAILQFQTLDAPNTHDATIEGNILIPASHTVQPLANLTNQLLAAFEPNDLRRKVWVDSSVFGGVKYFYPAKYKVRISTPDNITEYYMVLRFAEQYLIRAEAKAQQNVDLAGAIADLNTIRTRANLPPLSTSLNQAQVLGAVAQERRIEFFAEWGQRWFDLKRTGKADAVLGAIKPTWTPNAKLWPIPFSEITLDPNLTQNPGYQ